MFIYTIYCYKFIVQAVLTSYHNDKTVFSIKYVLYVLQHRY